MVLCSEVVDRGFNYILLNCVCDRRMIMNENVLGALCTRMNE